MSSGNIFILQEFHMNNSQVIMTSYLYLAGYALATGLLITAGLRLAFPKKIALTRKTVLGLSLVIFGILFLISKCACMSKLAQ